MPPQIPPFGPGDLAASALEDKDVLDVCALLDRSVDNHLGGNSLTTTLSLVGRDNNAGLAVVDAIAEGLGREAGKYD
jgi:hypothetical protein